MRGGGFRSFAASGSSGLLWYLAQAQGLAETVSVGLSAGKQEERDSVVGGLGWRASPRCSGRLMNVVALLHRLQYGTAHGKGA